MGESTELKFKSFFYPRPMGIVILLIALAAFGAGALRQIPALFLAGAVFSLPWVYFLLMTPLIAVFHKRRARCAFIRINPNEIAAGEKAEAVYCEAIAVLKKGEIAPALQSPGKNFFRMPGILVRLNLEMITGDGRRIMHNLDPAEKKPQFFTVEKRGAYYSFYDEYTVFDSLGFFSFVYRLPVLAGKKPRLLASPHPADEPVAIYARCGDSDLTPEISLQRTDDLTDHRPYIPGDDPRRINWKLYGHGGGLFVREGEYEPPPHSNILILTDSGYDPALYSHWEAVHCVDQLCENALAAVLACKESGMDVEVGCTGTIYSGTAAEIASALAVPYAITIEKYSGEFPPVPDDRGVLILALPRTCSDTALDHFLKNNHFAAGGNVRKTDIIFLCDNPARLAAAETCIALYNQRQGVRARIVIYEKGVVSNEQ